MSGRVSQRGQRDLGVGFLHEFVVDLAAIREASATAASCSGPMTTRARGPPQAAAQRGAARLPVDRHDEGIAEVVDPSGADAVEGVGGQGGHAQRDRHDRGKRQGLGREGGSRPRAPARSPDVTLTPFQALVDAHWWDVARLAAALAGAQDGADVAQRAWAAQALAAYPSLTDARNLRGWLLTITSRGHRQPPRPGRRPVPVPELPEHAAPPAELPDEHHGGGDGRRPDPSGR